MMHLMEGKILLDANVLARQQEIAKPFITNIVVPWVFQIFVPFHSFIHPWS